MPPTSAPSEGLRCAQALIAGKPLKGVWYARSEEYEAQRQAERRAARTGKPVEEIGRGAFMEHHEVKLAPLPCWVKLSTAAIRERVRKMVAEIEAQAAALRSKLGTKLVGMEKVRHQNPLDRSSTSRRSPIPLCHAASRAMRDRVKRAYRGFVEMYREASLKVKNGLVAEAIFPQGSFPPNLPFTRHGEVFDPLADAGGSARLTIWLESPD